MSGGALDYVSYKIEEAALSLPTDTPEFAALRDHLKRLANVMHDVEWALSSDISMDTAIDSVRHFLRPEDIAKSAYDNLVKAIEDAKTAQLWMEARA